MTTFEKGQPAEEAGPARTDLLVLLDVARRLAATSHLDDLLELILEQARKLLDAERASIFLYDPDRRELFSRLATGVKSIRFSVDSGLAGAAARQLQIINVPDAYADPRFNRDVDQRTGFTTRNLLSVPLVDYQGKLVGVLQVLNRREAANGAKPPHSGAFTPYHQSLAEMLAAQAGVALQRGRLLGEVAEKERMEREMAIARNIQQALLPIEDPSVAGFEVTGWNQPADQTGGDCFDFFALADGSLAVVVADATGHGIGPALMVAEARALFRAALGGSLDLAGTMSLVNRILSHDLPPDRFVTAFVGIVSPAFGRLNWASGGHGPMLLHRAGDDAIHQFDATAPPLGVLPELTDSTAPPVQMAPGDQFLIVTDGFFEYANEAGEEFGLPRIERWLRAGRDVPAAQAIVRLRDEVHAFAGKAPQNDDLTAVLIRKT